ncbi:hypothetical protein GCG21_02445 [Pseudactinotalea sp. HY160]|uniref:AAA family ATPase n=1 Tax=Pseudactinotalea sp. HY160 TaxID=2654490 RepID=UPI00128D42BA|nr:hypothetical protein [Pseudactinotalea sp. HY160]MPV48887.1 hypothetical protein [Pseudactinotalea sp. HY160]
MAEVALLIALRGPAEEFLIGEIAPRSDLVVTRRCIDAAEVLAAGLAGLGRLAIVAHDLGVDRALVARLGQVGVRTAVVTEPGRVPEVEAIGAVPLVGAGADLLRGIEALAESVRAGDRSAGADVPGAPDASDAPGFRASDAAGAPDPPDSRGSRGPAAEAEASGRIVAVTGPTGAPGRTTVAINLAAELVVDGGRTVLVDADVWGASIAPAFALTDTTAGLAAAVRAASRGTLDESGFERLCLPVTPGLRVLAGIGRAGRWREVAGPALGGVWEVARRAAPMTVIEAPVLVPEDDTDAFDQLGAGRNAVAASVFAAADAVVVVGAAEPIGIERLVTYLLDLRESHPQIDPIVVVTRLRASAAGSRPDESVREALARFAGVHDPVLVADDRTACDRALLSGGVLAETAPRSPARRGLRELAHRVGPPPAPPERTGGRRRARPRRRFVPAWAARRTAE